MALLSAPMLAVLYVSYTVQLLVLFRAFLSFLICFISWLLGSFILSFLSSIFLFILHLLTVPVVANLGAFERCCHFQNWLEFIMWICLAFKISVSLISLWGVAFELLYATYFSNYGHPQSLISSLHLLFTSWMLHFNSWSKILVLSSKHSFSKLGMLILYLNILLSLNIWKVNYTRVNLATLGVPPVGCL